MVKKLDSFFSNKGLFSLKNDSLKNDKTLEFYRISYCEVFPHIKVKKIFQVHLIYFLDLSVTIQLVNAICLNY